MREHDVGFCGVSAPPVAAPSTAVPVRWQVWGAALAMVLVGTLSLGVQPAAAAPGEEGLVEYQVISIEPQGWVTTARETATGNIVKFRLPPAAFHGQTFDADLGTVAPGQAFSVRGQRNVRLDDVVLQQGAGPADEEPRGRGRGRMEAMPPTPGPLTWEIVNVNAQQWVVTARSRQTRQTVKFKVDPATFSGFKFKADLKGIGQGKGFSLLAPNETAMAKCCTLLGPDS